MTVSEVRKRYLDFFAKRGHTIIPSASIVPENDPTTLFTSSGMQPLVPYLLGEPHPEGTRLVNSQLAVRTGDIEEVGDNRHLTFFEMLGNWSLGDYFKKDEIPWLYEFLTNELMFSKEHLWFTCFEGDESLSIPKDQESAELWQSLGVSTDHIRFYPARKNWWSRAGEPKDMPVGEIGGPDTEVFYDFGTPHDPAFGPECHQNCDCGRFVEICNAVFMEYQKKVDGLFERLPQRNVDFGGGLERLTATTLETDDLYLIDAFERPREILELRSGKEYTNSFRSFRIILDHVRAAVFMLASGIRPSNTEQGYVLPHLIRRSIREADKLGIKDAVLAEVAEGFGAMYREAYSMIYHTSTHIREELQKEEQQFRKTLTNGLRELEKMGDDVDAFMLFTTHGFPVELTAEIAREKGITIDMGIVKKKMEEHQALSRAGAAQKFAGGLADHAEQTVRDHNAHHILLKALQIVLGKDVHQRGSNITSERLRIDFSYGAKMTDEQKAEVEKIVNEKIAEAVPVVRTDIPREEAEKLGAEHEFGATYPAM